MKIGIMGGTFDPIHNGHLMLGHAAFRAFHLDKIWFMPNGNPPHKKSSTIKSSAQDRMEMTRRAIAPYPEFELQPYEALRQEVSCSYQTMEYFHAQYPDDEFYFIIGADSLMAIESWVHPERLFPTCTILATYRDEIRTKEAMLEQIRHLNQKYHAKILLLETSLMPVSSHELRAKMKAGVPVEAYIPASVETYIQEQNLYKKEGKE
nr:nicotinate-nucleotide adenylyltransferase [uncultured Dorea sp.]